jgi:hypothetical protein
MKGFTDCGHHFAEDHRFDHRRQGLVLCVGG